MTTIQKFESRLTRSRLRQGMAIAVFGLALLQFLAEGRPAFGATSRVEPTAPAPPADDSGVLLDALHDQDPDVRAIAAGLLGETATTDCRVVVALAGLLEDGAQPWRVRAAAAGSLQHVATECPAVLEALIRVAMTESEPWRLRAAALGSAQGALGTRVVGAT